ncbi:MAG: hypothetical protein E3J66_04530, partial [Dehalococcoidia bacterium]
MIDREQRAFISRMEKEVLSKRKLYSFLAKLRTIPGDYVNLYVKPSSFPRRISELLIEAGHDICAGEIKHSVANEALVREAGRYSTGAVIFWGENGEKHIVLPPFPISEDKVSLGERDASLLCESLERRYTPGVVL